MCQPKCRHSNFCAFIGTGYECDLTNDKPDDMCLSCHTLVIEESRVDDPDSLGEDQ